MSEFLEPNIDQDKDLDLLTKETFETFETWEDKNLNLKLDLLRGIYSYGFEKPSPIQQKSIISIIKGHDIIAQAQSGTGKTGAFSIGAIQNIDVAKNTTQVLLLSPTRELATQSYNVITSISNNMNIKTQLLIGGTFIDKDISLLNNNTPHIVVGCTGRVFDLIKRNHLKYKDIKLMILDEADEMLSIGFKEQVYEIFQYLDNNVQIALFSATMPTEIENLTNKFMRNPIKILVKAEMLTLEGISQYYIAFDDDIAKFSALKDLYESISVSQCIIYCNSIKRVNDLYLAMLEENFPVCCIHSGMEKEDRNNSYNEFIKGKFRVLISSNVTARGIDVQQVSTVINFDIPKCVRTYLHRIGRSGRWGRKGVGINFITKFDIPKMKSIESYYSTEIKELPAEFGNIF
jgi:superfamily II DNA/RNA helicase